MDKESKIKLYEYCILRELKTVFVKSEIKSKKYNDLEALAELLDPAEVETVWNEVAEWIDSHVVRKMPREWFSKHRCDITISYNNKCCRDIIYAEGYYHKSQFKLIPLPDGTFEIEFKFTRKFATGE